MSTDETKNQAQIQFRSTFAPLEPQGPLPPGLRATTVASAYRSVREDLRAKKVLATLGIQPGIRDSSTLLREVVDDPTARKQQVTDDGDPVRPPLFFAIYTLLKKRQFADEVYRLLVQPAEFQRNDASFLNPDAFAAAIAQHPDVAPEPYCIIAPDSPQEGLALFSLAYALLQPDDAAAILAPVLIQGAPL